MASALPWLLTYLLHSTLLLGGAALLCRALGERRLALQEAVLRAALVGGLLTASVQVGLGLESGGGVLVVSPVPAPAVVAPPATDAVAFLGPAPVAPARAEAGTAWRGRLGSVAGLVWAGCAVVAVLRLAVGGTRLRRLLRGRRPVANHALTERFRDQAGALGLSTPVRLSATARLSVPLAAGIVRPEVCLPVRVVEELEPEEQAALCAHELAHVARRDPAWILGARLIEALAPPQPLNTWARRRLQELAECLSDDLAVAAGARRDQLARSLVDVASWSIRPSFVLPEAALGAVSRRSRLGLRVERLMDPVRPLERPRPLLLPLAALAVLATALVLPIVTRAQTPAPPAEEEPPAPPAAPAPVPVPPAPSALAAPPALPAPPAPVAAPAPAPQAAPRAHAQREEIERLRERLAEQKQQHREEVARLAAEIRALREQFRPERQELETDARRLRDEARKLAEQARHEWSGEAREAARIAREAALQARAKMEEAMREMKRALEEQRGALEEMRRALQEELRERR
jgi:beta-lactamase regulating signal transducer with metallopeptidase domain